MRELRLWRKLDAQRWRRPDPSAGHGRCSQRCRYRSLRRAAAVRCLTMRCQADGLPNRRPVPRRLELRQPRRCRGRAGLHRSGLRRRSRAGAGADASALGVPTALLRCEQQRRTGGAGHADLARHRHWHSYRKRHGGFQLGGQRRCARVDRRRRRPRELGLSNGPRSGFDGRAQLARDARCAVRFEAPPRSALRRRPGVHQAPDQLAEALQIERFADDSGAVILMDGRTLFGMSDGHQHLEPGQ